VLVLAVAASTFPAVAAIAFPKPVECAPGLEATAVDGAWLCTHGDDAPPAGVDTTELPSTEDLYAARYGVTEPQVAASVAGIDAAPAVAAATSVKCIGDGETGPRVQLVYARASDTPSRFNAVVPLIRQYASDADDIVNVSAGRVGDGRRIRFVTNEACEPKVTSVTLTDAGDDTFAKTVTELRAQGLTDNDRKYLIFMDAAVGICGLGEVYLDDRAGQENPNNSGRPMFARVDTACWQHAAAHELLHTLGAVQNTAPNSSGAGHCTDEVDVMCYKDTTATVTKQVCSRAGQVDCNNDDYFHPNPKPSSYLATSWNVANSRFLETGSAPEPPAKTSVTVPSSGLAGLPWSVRADIATAGAGVAWSSTLRGCRFADPTAAATTFSCPATASGEAQVTVHITESGVTTPHAYPVTFVTPDPARSNAVDMSVSASSVTSGSRVVINGRLADLQTDDPIFGMPLQLWSLEAGSTSWNPVATMTTGLQGRVSAAVRPRRNTTYMLTSAGSSTWASTSSPQRKVTVATKVRARLSKERIRANRTTRVAGAVSPDKAGKLVYLKRYRRGHWVTVGKQRIREDSTYVFRYRPRRSGTARLRVVKPADGRNARGQRKVVLTVR
jgi:hypothetical protein